MATKRITIEAYYQQQQQSPLLDVRTPAEYEKGHIPGAINLPLFSNEERAEVGTIYKQVSPKEAFMRGLELVGPRMRRLVEKAEAVSPNGKVAVHCWRGGQRSNSVGWLLDLAGFDVAVLAGGYKAFRKYVLESLGRCDLSLLVIGGKTGSQKTEVLHQLRALGEQVLDLEGLANHKGSAFGALGEEKQPSVEHFENLLFQKVKELDVNRPVWVENESKAIGRVYLPNGFWNNMQQCPMIELEVPLEDRIQHLVHTYGHFSKQALSEGFTRIKKRLGGQHHKAALEALEKNDIAAAVAIALRYYDKAYEFHRQHKREDKAGPVIPFHPKTRKVEHIAAELVELANKENL